jgi:hypothetical protein
MAPTINAITALDGMPSVFTICAPLQIDDDLRETEEAHGHDHESDAVRELRQAEGIAEQAGIRVCADKTEQQSEGRAGRWSERRLRTDGFPDWPRHQ